MEATRVIRPKKKEAVELLVSKLNSAKSVFLTDYSGLTVEAVTGLRRNLRSSNVEYLVSKNTLSRIAANEVGMSDIVPFLRGPIALAFGMDDPAAPAKVFKEFLKDHDKPAIKAIVIEGQYFDASRVDEIASLPGREELLARLAAALNSPITGLANSLQGILRNFVYALKAVEDKKKESEGAQS